MLQNKCKLTFLFSLLLFPTIAMATAVPAPSGMWATYANGRQVGLQWTRIIVPDALIQYDIYRDNEKLATIIDGQKDSETNGQIWSYNATYQFFNDKSAWPGKTHNYKIIAKVGKDDSAAISRDVVIPVPVFSGIWATYQTGRTTQLQWTHIDQNFPDMKYQVFRDEAKLTEFQIKTSGSTTYGDTWTANASYQFYNDTNVIPGKTHKYKIVAILFEGHEAIIQIEKEITIPVPSFTGIWTTYQTGRKVQIQWNHLNQSFPNIRYQVFRDDIKLSEFQTKSSGDGENGDAWSFNASYQYYYDNNAVPGKIHKYKIIATLFEGHDAIIMIEKELAIPIPTFTGIRTTYQNGRTVQLQWNHVDQSFPGIKYQVLRDDIKLTEFQSKSSGSAINGDTWSSNASYQYYNDNNAFPGKTHTYKIIANLFQGCDAVVEVEKKYLVPDTLFNSINFTYPGVRTVQIYWNRIAFPGANVKYTVYRDENELATFDSDIAGSAANGDSWKVQNSYQYYTDVNAWPGKKHQYKVVASIFPGCELTVEKEYQVPSSILSGIYYTYQNQRNVRLYWVKIPSHPTFDPIQYIVYRDGIKLASFGADVQGTGTNNDSWSSDASYQYYVDGSAIPWAKHTYSIEARLFEGCDVTHTNYYTVPGPKISSPSPTVISVTSASLNLGSNSANSFADELLEIFRNGQKIATLRPINNSFPSTYVDNDVDVPNGEHYYQFRFQMYPGCDSGLSQQFPLAIPTPQAPTLSVIKTDANAVTIRCVGANIKNPQSYRIYRDGVLVGTSTSGAQVDYVDSPASSGTLYKYEAKTVFDGFPESYVSSISKPVYATTALSEEQVFSVVTKRESAVSPAWVEGDSARTRLPLSFTVDGGVAHDALYYSDEPWYLDNASASGKPKGILLSPDRPTAVSVTSLDPNFPGTVDVALTWTTTDITGINSAEPAFHVRKGDSLLLTAHGEGEHLSISVNDGVERTLSGVPGEVLVVSFDQSGAFVVSAQIDGIPVGAMGIAVAAVSNAPEVSYLRTLSASSDNYTALGLNL